MKQKLFKPYVNWRAKWYALKTLSTTQLAEGPVVKQFENEFSNKFGLRNVVALNSGTSALEMAYELAGIKAGDEVITPVFTCTATNIPLVRLGAKLVFADIDYDLNVNIEDVQNKITNKTKAIVFVHFGGNARGLDNLVAICRERNITLIEDAAQAVGGTFGKGDFTCISLQAIKTLTSGDGGFLICKHDKDYEKAKKLKWFGYDRELKQSGVDVDLDLAGYKMHMNDISASIGLGNLRVIDKILKHREEIAQIYRDNGLFAYHWLAGGFTNDYTGLKERMAKNGVEIGKHHYRNDRYTLFKKYKNDCPIMDELESKYFFVPFHYGVSKRDAHKINGLLF